METKNKFQKLINFFIKYGIIIISILITLIGFLSIFITASINASYDSLYEKTSYKYSIGILEIIFSIAFVVLLAIFCKKILNKIHSEFIILPIIIAWLFIFIGWVDLMHLAPTADQAAVDEIATFLINNNNVAPYLVNGQYLSYYPFQLGIAYIFSIIYRIFGQNYMNIQYINVLCSLLNMFLLFLISKEIFKEEKIQKILVLLVGIFGLYFMFFNVHVYGNIIGLTLALLSLLFTLIYLRTNKFYNIILAGLFISISIIAKSNYNIFLCGIIAVLILNIIKKWNLKEIIVLPIIVVSILAVNTTYNLIILKKYNVKLPKGTPMLTYVYMGMNKPTDMSPGWYNADGLILFRSSGFDYDKTVIKTKALINERLSYFAHNPKEFISYYSQKIASTWLNPTFQAIWCSVPAFRYSFNSEYAEYLEFHQTAISMVDYKGTLYNIEENIFNIYQIIIFIFAGIGIFLSAKENNLSKILLPIIFIGGLLFHILWETKAIYVLQYYFLLLPYTAFGLNFIFDKLTILINKKYPKLKEKNE